jgi:5-methylcytosine-specific restriction endonuclease McrA
LKRHHIQRICARPEKTSAPPRRTSLNAKERAIVVRTTNRTGHVCGGRVGKSWQADHVVPHKLGGRARLDNYLPICKECNRLRWSYSPEVIRLIMRLGTYAKNEIRRKTELGEQLLSLLLKRLGGNRKRRIAK